MPDVILSEFDPATFAGNLPATTPRRGPTSRHPERAGTACQCVAPEPCTAHPDDHPLVLAEPPWNTAAPDSPVGRTHTRHLARTPGSLPYRDEPGEVRYETPPLRYLTDIELGEWTRALLAEHHRRLTRFGQPT